MVERGKTKIKELFQEADKTTSNIYSRYNEEENAEDQDRRHLKHVQ